MNTDTVVVAERGVLCTDITFISDSSQVGLHGYPYHRFLYNPSKVSDIVL